MPVNANPPGEDYQDNTEWLVDTLPTFFANDTDSGNWHLFAPVGDQIDTLDSDIEAVDRATDVQRADTIDQLERLAKLVEVTPRDGESKEHFRARTFARYQLNTAEGTISDVLNSVATILNINVERVGYVDIDREAAVGIIMPKKAVDTVNLSESEVSDILHDLVPAGYEVRGQIRGTFTYVSVDEYDSTSDWSNYNYGYDSLDGTGTNTPTGEGGTYAGLLD